MLLNKLQLFACSSAVLIVGFGHGMVNQASSHHAYLHSSSGRTIWDSVIYVVRTCSTGSSDSLVPVLS